MAVLLIALAYNMYQTHTLNKKVNSFKSDVTASGVILPEGFDDTKTKFSKFNPYIDTNTIVVFLNVVDTYSLRKESYIFDALVGQILTESCGRQFYIKGQKNEGQVVRGTSGEVGIAQIMPKTAQGYLKRLHDNNERLYGTTDFSFIADKSFSSTTLDELTIKWLSNVNNNLALWGYIMNEHLNEMGLFESLIAYNTGKGGMKRFVEGNDPDTHSYVQKVLDTVFKAELGFVVNT